MAVTARDAYTVDSVVSDVPGTRKIAVDHFVSLNSLTGLVDTDWRNVLFPFWNDGGSVDDDGYYPLRADHVISLKNIMFRLIIGMNGRQSDQNEFVTFLGCNFRIVEYSKASGSWVVNQVLVSDYGSVSDEHGCVLDHGGFNNFVFKRGYAYEFEVRLRANNFSPQGNAIYGTANIMCDLYESF